MSEPKDQSIEDEPDAGKEDEQQNRTEHSNGNCDCFDHLYCFP